MVDVLIRQLKLRVKAAQGIYVEQCREAAAPASGSAVVASLGDCRETLFSLDQRLDALASRLAVVTINNHAPSESVSLLAEVQALLSTDTKVEEQVSQIHNCITSSLNPTLHCTLKRCSCYCCHCKGEVPHTSAMTSSRCRRLQPALPFNTASSLNDDKNLSCDFRALPFSSYSPSLCGLTTSRTAKRGSYNAEEMRESPLSARPFSSARLRPQSRRRQQQSPTLIPHVSVAEFLVIPPHLRQRLTVEKLNDAVDAINTFLLNKYSPVAAKTHRKSSGTSHWESLQTSRSATSQHHEDTDATRDTFWFSETDVRLFGRSNFKMDATGKSILAALRTLQRLLRLPGGGPVRYCLPSLQSP